MTDSTSDNSAATVATRVAQFVAATNYCDLPPELLDRAKLAILDTVGAAIAGARTEGCSIIREYIIGLGCDGGGATIFGTKMRTLPRFAALANGSAINTDDFDDTYHPSRTHPSGPVLAAAFAQAEQLGSSGKDVLAAFSVGSEVTCKISQAMSKEHYQRGFHITSTCGVIGAAAGVSHLLRLPLETTCAAIGIGASHSAGFRENFGSMTKALHSGRAAESGVVAGSLAGLGFTAAPTILEGPRGFFMASGGGYDAKVICDGLGHPWSYVSPGVAIKPFPSGNISHPAMCKMLELVLAHDIRSDQVQRVKVKSNRLVPLNLTFHQPKTGLQGQLSMEFCLAAMLTLRRAGLPEFTDAVVNSPEIQQAIAKIDYTTYSDDEAAVGKYAFLTTFIDIEMNDGRRFSGRVDAAQGSAALPMSANEVADKFRSCGEYVGWPAERIEKSIELILRLEDLHDVRSLTELLRR
jgi:2-methylcitrate dehydratase PrpD